MAITHGTAFHTVIVTGTPTIVCAPLVRLSQLLMTTMTTTSTDSVAIAAEMPSSRMRGGEMTSANSAAASPPTMTAVTGPNDALAMKPGRLGSVTSLRPLGIRVSAQA
jgi:hypothetical protein